MAKGDRYVTCPRCGGMGVIQKTTKGGIISVTCSKCGGSGRAKAGCFVTTAVCETLGRADDCELLTKLRSMRQALSHSSEGAELIEAYQEIGPKLVKRLHMLPSKERMAMANRCVAWLGAIAALHDEGKLWPAVNLYKLMLGMLDKELPHMAGLSRRLMQMVM